MNFRIMNFELSSMEHHHITAEHLSGQARREILERRLPLALSDDARARIVRCREYDRKMGASGRSTASTSSGRWPAIFGGQRRAVAPATEPRDVARLRNRGARALGDRAADSAAQDTVARLRPFGRAAGDGGASRGVFNRGILPVVYQQGSLGASGDLAPLAHMSLPLLGLGEVEYKGEVRPSAEVLAELGLEPIRLQSKEGLALLNGTQFMSAYGVWSLIHARRLSEWADRIGALSLERLRRSYRAFLRRGAPDPRHQGALATARNVLELLEGSSELIARPKHHVQDPYSFPLHAAGSRGLEGHDRLCGGVLTTKINSTTDNPTVFPEEVLKR